MCPEMQVDGRYSGQQADAYAIGITIYYWFFRHYPFGWSTDNKVFVNNPMTNPAYRQFLDYPEAFWQGKDGVSDDFKEMTYLMLQDNPIMRPSLNDILEHKWMKS